MQHAIPLFYGPSGDDAKLTRAGAGMVFSEKLFLFGMVHFDGGLVEH
jgi:hypothetical protein